MYNVDWDITVEFYYKYASWKSPITGTINTIKIKRVHYEMIVSKTFPYWEKEIIIRSYTGIDYDQTELFNFRVYE